MVEETPTWKPGCKAIVDSTGTQCGAGDDDVCGTHENSRSLRRVDDFDVAPNEELRDDLIEECDINGTIAFALATMADSPREVWDVVTALEPVDAGWQTWDINALATHAKNIAKHPDLYVDGHPLAEDRCLALTGSEKFDGRCTSGGYGTGLLCGMDQGSKSLETIYESDEWESPGVERVDTDEGTFWFVEERDGDAIVVTPEWLVERRTPDSLPSPVRDHLEAALATDDAGDETVDPDTLPTRPPMLDAVQEDDVLEVVLENGRRYQGRIKDVSEGTWTTDPDEIDLSVYLEVEAPDSQFRQGTLVVETNRDARGEWSKIQAFDFAVGEAFDETTKALGDVQAVKQLDEDALEDDDDQEDIDEATDAEIEDSMEADAGSRFAPLDEKTVVLVGCGDAKRDHAAPARDLYTSTFFGLKRNYAETVGDYWYVLSAEHGLVPPNKVLEPYDTEITGVDGDEWEARVRGDLPNLSGATVIVLAGRDYIEAGGLETTLSLYADDVEYPLAGKGLFEQQSWLSDRLDALRTDPIPADDLPKYLHEGLQKQSAETLRRLAPLVENLAEEQAERNRREFRENAEMTADETPDEWGDEAWASELEDAFEDADLESGKGTLTTKTIDGRDYYYLQWWADGGTESQYVAPVVPSDGD
jgi:hypothetical protein